MWKIIFSLFICIFLFVSHSEGTSPSFVSLWKSGEMEIQGILPAEWRPLKAEELAALISAIPENITQQSGKMVSGFQIELENKKDNSPSYNSRIMVFVKTDEYVNLEMIQKTYAWLEKNRNLLAGMLSDQVEKASIQNIEYKQNLPAILFQNNLSVNEHLFTELSSIVFLKGSIMSIVCITEEKKFAEYKTVFHSFIESIVIPVSLRHTSVNSSQHVPLLTGIFAVLERKWQPLLGVFIIIGIYAWVYRTSDEKKV